MESKTNTFLDKQSPLDNPSHLMDKEDDFDNEITPSPSSDDEDPRKQTPMKSKTKRTLVCFF